MKWPSLFLIPISFLVFFSECSIKEKKQLFDKELHNSTLALVINKSDIRSVKASEIFDNISYIKLEKSGNTILSSIDKCVATEQYLFILDKEKTKTLFVYDWNGNLISEIYKEGKGPGEYLFPQDFNVNADGTVIEILDSQGKLLSFGMNGNYIKSIDVEFNVANFHKIDDAVNYLFFTPKSSNTNFGDNLACRFIRYSINDKNVHCLIDTIPNNKPYFDERVIFAHYEDEIIFSETFNDTIYMYKKDILTRHMILDFGDIKFPESFFDKSHENGYELLMAFNKTKGAFHTPMLLMNDQIIYTAFRYNSKVNLFYFRETKRLELAEHLLNDLDMGVSDMPIVSLYENEVIATVEAYKMIEQLETIKSKIDISKIKPQKLLEFIKFTEELDMTDPPILVILHLKNP